ncbi:MAG: 3',5'-cyclic adenosine monophosphate phosphodiesterase CpdA [Phycisphaerae bacterium]|nr:3',5'-cyclic adenosine monophosphate phosphodiesterase CpdA [Phycisphaerae bacterium]
MRSRRILLLGIAVLFSALLTTTVLLGPGACSESLRYSPAPPVVERPRSGGTDVTFLVTADLHFGSEEVSDAMRKAMAEAINGLPGRDYPAAIGGKVAAPMGILAAGDLTERGDPEQWDAFAQYFSLDGRRGPVGLPMYESVGNHDTYRLSHVAAHVKRRHGDVCYSWDWGDLHVVCLGEAPDERTLVWLRKDLAGNGRSRPIVLYLHYPFVGPYSDTWFTKQDGPEKLWKVIDGFNVAAIFHGHFHGSGHYLWHGIDVYNVGSIKHGQKSFGVVRVTDTRLTFCSFNFQAGAWWWWHSKPINGAKGQALLDAVSLPGIRDPLVQWYPTEQ